MEIDIRKIFRILLAKWPIIAIVSVLMAVVGVLYSLLMVTPMYSSTATIWAGVFEDDTSEYQQTLTVQYRLKTYAEITKKSIVLKRVVETLEIVKENGDYDGPVYTVNQLQNMISTSVATDSELFTITVSNADKRYAQFIVNQVADEACQYLQEEKSTATFTVIEEGVMPTSPYTMSTAMYAVIFFMVGFIGAAAACVLYKLFDVRITNENDIKEIVDITIIGVIPTYDFSLNDEVYSQEGVNRK